MKEKKDIDRLFQESFKEFEATPKDHVWENIANKLQHKKKRKIIPLWYKLTGVAAILIAGLFIGNFLINTPQQKVVHTDSKKITEPKTDEKDKTFNKEKTIHQTSTETLTVISIDNSSDTVTKLDRKNSKNHTNDSKVNINSNLVLNNTSSIENNYSVKNQKLSSTSTQKINSSANSEEEKNHADFNSGQNNSTKTLVHQENLSSEEQSLKSNLTHNLDEHNKENKFIENTNPLNKERIIIHEKPINENTSIVEENSADKTKNLVEVAKELNKEGDNEKEKDNVQQLSKWLIKANISPIYYGSLNGSNNLDKTLAGNNTKGEVTMAYGINFAYAISEKIKVRSGISKVNMSYNINDIAYSTNVNATRLEGITSSPNYSSIEVLSIKNQSKPATSVDTQEFSSAPIAPDTKGVINQQLGYLEIPVEVEYALLNKRFGINLIGGASTLLLNDNSISINSNNGQLSLGEANNLNKVSFTTNLGLGFGYNLSEKFEVNLEPTFKYQLNTYNNTINDFKPYYFGVYTGFSFKF
ncbi:hypothetical protein [Mesonia aestuariivivens]|uniref:Outer membrane protein beta-barrel domain-containing protein n=1 Tax=Mesonia aestuariivivens TaxID=2796128 RepID=A0ABS6W1M2_9FLAO|nr:hypothetical protein [Mesonia aestuariivivens]MBW2961639.1 hypothetical protein [Mesonia aestuariivivens]